MIFYAIFANVLECVRHGCSIVATDHRTSFTAVSLSTAAFHGLAGGPFSGLHLSADGPALAPMVERRAGYRVVATGG